MPDNKKTILENALLEYEEIKKAAEAKLAAELPEKFQNILKEELNKNNNTSANDSYKKINENNAENNKDSEMKKEKKDNKINEEFDLTDLDIDKVESTTDNLGDDDTISIDEIEKVLSDMETPEEENEPVENPDDIMDKPIGNLTSLKGKLEELLKEIDSFNPADTEEITIDAEEPIENSEEDVVVNPENANDDELPVDNNIDYSELNLEELEEMLNFGDDNEGSFEPTEDELEEALGVSISAGTITPGKLPNDMVGGHGRFRDQQNESVDKKYNALLERNKKLIKKINETKEYKKQVSTLLDNYKGVLTKYRTQLKEMAIYNTNLSNVNNLLVNESLALTQDDKIKIIKEFKSINTINESKEKYTSLLNDLKSSSTKRIDESVVDKVNNDSIQPSSKGKLDEVIEKTAYQNNDHLGRIKDVINKIEHR